MAPRPTMYCDTCESTVYADDVHSCYDAKRVRTVAERERAVIDAAVAYCAEVERVKWDEDEADAYEALYAAVRSLREVTP